MTRPINVLILLIVLGTAAGYLFQKAQGASKNLKPTASNEAGPAGLADLQKQVDSLKEQVTSLQKEFAALSKPQEAMQEPMEAAPQASALPDKPSYAELSGQLVAARGFGTSPIPIVEVPRVEVGEKIAEWLGTQFPAEQGELQGRALAALGAIHEPTDTILMKAGFLAYQIGGWYDGATNTLFVADRSDVLIPGKENALAVCYGEIFKRYGSKLFPPNKQPVTLDGQLAKDALMSGDAAFMRFRHAIENPEIGGGGGVGEDPEDPSRAVAIPNFLREVELLPYTSGLSYVQGIYEKDSWQAVNATYDRPPLSAADIKDAASASTAPGRMKMADKLAVLQQEPFWRDRLGPLALIVFLRQHVADAMATKTAPGWLDDQLLAYDNTASNRPHAVWQTLWKDGDAATLFFNTIKDSLGSRYRGEGPLEVLPKGAVRLSTKERTVIISRTHNGQGVVFIDAGHKDFAHAALDQFTAEAGLNQDLN